MNGTVRFSPEVAGSFKLPLDVDEPACARKPDLDRPDGLRRRVHARAEMGGRPVDRPGRGTARHEAVHPRARRSRLRARSRHAALDASRPPDAGLARGKRPRRLRRLGGDAHGRRRHPGRVEEGRAGLRGGKRGPVRPGSHARRPGPRAGEAREPGVSCAFASTARRTKKGGSLPTFVMLTTLSAEGVQTVKNNPSRIREVNKEIESLGASVKAQWATLGRFDFVNVVEAPDEKTMARVSMELGSRGTARYESLAAIPIDEFIAAL